MGAIMKRAKARRKRIRKRKDMVMNAKQDAKDQRAMAKISKKNAKRLDKIYKGLDPNEINEINKIQPYVGKMQEQLAEQGVEVSDPNDPIETAMLYNQEVLGDEGFPVDDVIVDTAYTLPDESFESYEHAERQRGLARDAVKGVFAGVSTFIGSRMKDAKNKKKKGGKLTAGERALLEADETGNEIKKDYVKKEVSKFKDLGIILLILGIAWLAFK